MSSLSEMEVWGRIPQANLARRERFRVRVEPCACGTQIVAEDDPATWTEAVGRHNRSSAHTLWWVRARCEWQGPEG